MRPYFLVAYNFVRFNAKKFLGCRNFHFSPIEMLGMNTKLTLHKKSSVCFGDRLISDGRMVIITDSNSKLQLGNGVYFNENAMISCKSQITVGDGCRFGPNVKIFDNNHLYSASSGVSSEHVTSPISIGKNCWIGANVVILRGTSIADNSVIGAGCIVQGSIPEGSLVTQDRTLIVRPIEERTKI